ncbi:MAG: agmatine deiminase family protein [Pirellulaceae bacterium]
MNHSATPQARGCRWPAEWEPHAATWIAWPHRERTWPGHFELIPHRFARIIQTLSQFEPVHVLAGGDAVMAQAQAMVGHLERVVLHDIPTNDAWVRDFGPTFLAGPDAGQVSMIDWEFNAWGGKYPAWDLDNRVPREISRRLQLKRFEPGIVLEGGSIDGNGCGAILTTESCLLDPRRNPDMRREDIEHVLREFCCAADVIWLAGGPLAGDDTDGHVDQLARFVGPQHVVVAVENDPHDVHYAPLQVNLQRLQAARQRWPGESLCITPLPLPPPVLIDGRRVPASYCNFYIANGCVLMPCFEDPADDLAREILQPLFPGRQVIGLPAREIIWGRGAFHCLTQQQPAGTA